MGLTTANIAPQGEAIYRLLLKGKGLTASSIAKELRILPHAVYRSVKPLIALGLVEQLDTYPASFQALSIEGAMNTYLLTAPNGFLEKFFSKQTVEVKPTTALDISFIQNREELLARSNSDIHDAKSEAHHLVSGLEVPADTVLELQNAAKRGVHVRFLVQKLNEVNRVMLGNLQKLGIDVRYFPLLEARVIIIDQQIVYITSYNPNKKNEATGVRFNYPPIAKLMNDVFLQRWNVGKAIDSLKVLK